MGFCDHISGAGCIIHWQFYKMLTRVSSWNIFLGNFPGEISLCVFSGICQSRLLCWLIWEAFKVFLHQCWLRDSWAVARLPPSAHWEPVKAALSFPVLLSWCLTAGTWNSESVWECRLFLVPETEQWDASYVPWADWQCLQLISYSSLCLHGLGDGNARVCLMGLTEP